MQPTPKYKQHLSGKKAGSGKHFIVGGYVIVYQHIINCRLIVWAYLPKSCLYFFIGYMRMFPP